MEILRAIFSSPMQATIGVAAGIIGFLLSAPIVWLLYRLAFRGKVPRIVYFWGKVLIGVLCGVLAFNYLHLGPGGGLGLFFGNGGDGGKGTNTGTGTGTGTSSSVLPANTSTVDTVRFKSRMEILLLGPKHKVQNSQYYLVDNKEPAVDLKAIEQKLLALEPLPKDFQVTIILNKDSVQPQHKAVKKLQDLLEEPYQITESSLKELRGEKVPEGIVAKLAALKDTRFYDKDQFVRELGKTLDEDERTRFEELVLKFARQQKIHSRLAIES